MPAFRDNFRGASTLLGCARVSTDGQDVALQRRAVPDPASESVREIIWPFVPASTHKARFGPASPYRANVLRQHLEPR